MHRGVPPGPPLADAPAAPPRHEQVATPVRTGELPALADGFIARPETASGLHAALRPGAAVALVPRPPAAEGPQAWLGPCGKTQLAVALAESLWQSRQLDLLVWVTATSRMSVLSGYVTAATATGPDPSGDAEAVAARFVSWLRETSQTWLMVIDGLADAKDLAGLWPQGPSGRVLITADDPAVLPAEHRAVVLPVGLFSPREALGYLMGRLTADPDQRIGAIDLIDDLGWEPLALAQASGVIASSGLSCRDYSDYFNRRREQLADASGVPPAAAVTWTFSVEQADRLSPDGAAQAVLALAGLLDGHRIPGMVFTTSAVLGYMAGDDADQQDERHRIRGALLLLQRTGLLTIEPGVPLPTVRMARVVQDAVRQALPEGMLDRAVGAAASALLEIWPAGDQPDEGLAADLRSCAASLQRAAGDRLWAAGCHPLLLQAGKSLASARLTGPAVSYWREIAAVSDRVLGPDHPDTLAAGEQLATAYLTAGRAAEAVPWCQWVLARRVRELSADHRDTLAARRDLGHALTAAGQLSEAITVLEGAARDYQRVCGPDHPDALSAQDDLAAAYRGAGRCGDAIALSRRVLADRERVQGAQHPDTTSTRQQLAGAYLAHGRVKDAIGQYKRVLADTERTAGPWHLETAAARSQLGSAYYTAGRMASALQLYEQARSGYEQILGADHPEALARSADLAHAYYAAGRLTDAATLLRETIARCQRALPSGDPLTASLRESLANIDGR